MMIMPSCQTKTLEIIKIYIMEKLVELYDMWHNSMPVNTVRLAGAGSNRAYYRLFDEEGIGDHGA